MKSKLKQLIKDFSTLNPDDYVREEELENRENEILDYVLENHIVSQEWFDERLKHTSVERLQDLIKEM
tara:strand:- start:1488 stop:1691 length:204 start_codon:yes stop_codon:yes gene_type:complete